MIGDPVFWLAAVLGVVLFGVSKGGFAGGFGIVAVPLMALAIPPAQAAAVMLPILLCMDVGAVWAYRRRWSRELIRILLPAGLAGTAIGTVAFRHLSSDGVRILLGAIAIGFVLYRVLRRAERSAVQPPSVAKGVFWGTLSGATSFIAHSGGPPISVYLLPLRLAPSTLVGTVAVLFAALNWSKVLPYWWLGLFSTQNLLTSLALVPVGLSGVALGVWLHRRVNEVLFYRLIYTFLTLTGLKLLYDGLT
ncbi:MAG: hypothetical protein A3I63_09895 [Betaproteobacteria bacterium RIFCSPLOWO2_02_FULL_66_14]|nr:MAG: hypothetical protein A3I63_09895 [Betaproteobacteria bacterium RIFCSPLOWO2_02_FULL_66_14]